LSPKIIKLGGSRRQYYRGSNIDEINNKKKNQLYLILFNPDVNKLNLSI